MDSVSLSAANPSKHRAALLAGAAYWLAASLMAVAVLNSTAPALVLGTSPAHTNMVVVGELIAGHRVVQPLSLPSQASTQPFAVVIHFATYARANAGQIEIVLSQAERETRKTVAATELAEGVPIAFAVPSLGWQPGPAVLSITGIDGQPGSAITAWASTDLTGPPAQITGLPRDRQLLVNFQSRGTVLERAQHALGSLWWVAAFMGALLLGGYTLLRATLSTK